ncbi:MAG: hypothetical protein NTU81_00985 [Candidatus Nomurabacteria bacterium]|nr:hypothetical protein [Candidatus Nomurabacteria bacterium]
MLDIAHSFVNIFAGGRSEIKTLLFFLYLLLIISIYYIFKKNSIKNIKWIYFGLSLVAMYIYGFILHIYYIVNNNLNITDFVITGNNGEISSSVFSHTHIAKAFIGQIFSLFGKNQFHTTDAGSAYIGIFPNYLFLFGSLLLIILIIQSIYYFGSSYKKILDHKNNRQKIFLIIGYSLVSFSLIKTSIDGGLFNPSFILGIIFVYLFILREKGKLSTNYYYIASLIGIILLFVSLYLDTTIYNKLSLGLASTVSLFLLYTFVLYASESKIRLQFLFSILMLFMLSWWQASPRDRDIHDYSSILIQSGQEVYFYNENKKEIELLKVDHTESIAQLSKQLNKNITYTPISSPGLNCMKNSKPSNISFTLVTYYPISKNILTPSRFLEFKNNESIFVKSNWRTDFNAWINPCTPELLSVVDGELQKKNINTYMIVNPTSYDTTNN